MTISPRTLLAAGVVLAGVAFAVIRGPDLQRALTTDEIAPAFQLTPVNVDVAPPWRLPRVGRGHLVLDDLRGQVAMLYFWASW